MTPRQLHALEWAIKEAEYGRDAVFAGYDTRQQYDEWKFNLAEAKRALAYAWKELRQRRIEASARPPLKTLQRASLAVTRKKA